MCLLLFVVVRCCRLVVKMQCSVSQCLVPSVVLVLMAGKVEVVVAAYYGEIVHGVPRRDLVPPEYYAHAASEQGHQNVIGVAVRAVRALGVPASSFSVRTTPVESIVDLLRGRATQAGAGGVVVCVWWDHSYLPAPVIRAIQGADMPCTVRHVVFNWDPTRGCFALPADNIDLWQHAYVSDSAAPAYGCPTTVLYPPVDCGVFRPLPAIAPRWAITFACTNFYNTCPNVTVARRDLCAALARAFGPRFGLFGPESIQEQFAQAAPECVASFSGHLRYSDIPYVAAASTVCLNLFCDNQVHGYLNERVVNLAACGATILTDSTPGCRDLFKNSVTYIEAGSSVDAVVDQVRLLLAEAESSPDHVSERRAKARHIAETVFRDTLWAQTIINDAAAFVQVSSPV